MPNIVLNEDEILIKNNDKIEIYDFNLNFKREFAIKTSKMFKKYLTKDKKLYFYDKDFELKYICDIQREINHIMKINNYLLFSDVTGNIFLHKDKLKLISGNFSPYRGMILINENIYLADKHGKIRKCNFFGDIVDIYFTDEIISIFSAKSCIYVLLESKIEILNENFEKIKEVILNKKFKYPVKMNINSYKDYLDIFLLQSNFLYKLNDKLEIFKENVLDFEINRDRVYILDLKFNLSSYDIFK